MLRDGESALTHRLLSISTLESLLCRHHCWARPIDRRTPASVLFLDKRFLEDVETVPKVEMPESILHIANIGETSSSQNLRPSLDSDDDEVSGLMGGLDQSIIGFWNNYKQHLEEKLDPLTALLARARIFDRRKGRLYCGFRAVPLNRHSSHLSACSTMTYPIRKPLHFRGSMETNMSSSDLSG